MNSPEEYENLIALLEKALEFYADPKNYEGTVAMIDHDEYGSQARFALSKSKEMVDNAHKMQEDYDRLMAAGEMLQATEDKADPEKLMNYFKILGDKSFNESIYTEEERKHVNEMKENMKDYERDNNV
jgi:hypothetical protein